MDDLYARLGVSRGASQDEIKRGYRKEALKHHPDRGGDTAAFQKIEEANSVLSNPERKAMYDATGSVSEGPGGQGFNPFGGGFNVNLSEMFGQMFGGQGGGPHNRKPPVGPHKLHEIGVSLSDLYHGKQFELRMKRDVLCSTCDGHGGMHVETCSVCHGSGVRVTQVQMGPMTMIQQGPCDSCQGGSGKKVRDTCTACAGKKVKESESALQVKIEPGMQEGERLTFAGQCSESPEFERPGDVILVLRASSAEGGSWIREGSTLKRHITLTWAEALLGFERELDAHPSGRPLHIVWTGGFVKEGEVLRVVGWGMPDHFVSNAFGDLRLICHLDGSVSIPADRLATLQQAFPDWKAPTVRSETILVCGGPEDRNTHCKDC
jgi:DnaJ family protein A protein 2